MVRKSLLLIAIFLSGYGNFSLAQQSSLIRFVDEGGKTFAQAEAVIQDGGLYFTIEALREAFDQDLKQQYSFLTKALTLNLKGKRIRLRIGVPFVTVDPQEKKLPLSRPPLIIGRQPMLPLEFFTEFIRHVYDIKASYNPVLKTIHIKKETALHPNLTSPSVPAQHAEFLVVVDPGHGGTDSGCRGNTGVLEKDIVLNFAEQIQDTCREHQIPVLLTRDTDMDRRPTERIDIARRNQGKLFLSFHCNASFSPQAEGIHLCVNNSLGELHSENPSVESNEMLQHDTIIKALSQEDFLGQSRQFASILQKELAPFSRSPIPLTEIPLATLSRVYMPAVLVEIGYLSNDADEARLKDAGSVASMATVISQAIQKYITALNQVGEAENVK